MAARRFYFVALLVGTTMCCILLNTSQCKEDRLFHDFDAMFQQMKATRNGIVEIYNHFNVLLSTTGKQYGSNQHLINTADLGNYSLRAGNKVRSKRRFPNYIHVDIKFYQKWLMASAVFSLILIYELYFPADLYIKWMMVISHCYHLYSCVLRKDSMSSAKWVLFVRSKNQRLHFVAMILSWLTCTWMSISITTNTIIKERTSLVPLVVYFNVLLVYATLWMIYYFEGGDIISYIKQEVLNASMPFEQVYSGKELYFQSRLYKKELRKKRFVSRYSNCKSHKAQCVTSSQSLFKGRWHSELQTNKASLPVLKSNSVNCSHQQIGTNSKRDIEPQSDSLQNQIFNACRNNHQNKTKTHTMAERANEPFSVDTVTSDYNKLKINSSSVCVTFHQGEFSNSQEYVSTISNTIATVQQEEPHPDFDTHSYTFPLRRDRSVSEDEDLGQVILPSHFNAATDELCMHGCSLSSNPSITHLTDREHVFTNKSEVIDQLSCTETPSPDRFEVFLDELINGQVYETNKQMEYEMMRLQTFNTDLTISCSKVRLAQSGFYATGNDGEVKCFSCGVCHNKWRKFDSPHIIHDAISPGCSMVLGTDTNNMPVQIDTTLRLKRILTSGSFGGCGVQTDARYTMNSTQRGIAIIINNEIFNQPLEERHGTHIDAERMCRLWRHLGFEVEYHENATAEKMLNITEEAALIDHSKYDCLVYCILTHGDCGMLFGTDGRSLTIDQITGHFLSGVCEHLAGKPKLFFIQACQGSTAQTGYAIPTDANKICSGVMVNSSFWHRIMETIPQEADFLLSYSTVPGYVSFRCRDHGTWYIRSLQTNLLNYYSRFDLDSILTLVNLDVGKSENKEGDMTYKQIPMYMSTLRKRVYFS